MSLLFSFFTIPTYMATAFVITLVSLKRDEYVPYVAITGALMSLAFSLLAVPSLFGQGIISMQMEEWVAPFGITIFGDFLSVFLANVVALVGLMAVVFSFHYIQERRTKYYALLSLMFAGLFGVIHSGDLFNLFVFTEVMSLASYGLVAFNKRADSLEASIKYLIMGSIGTSFMLIGVAFVYGLTGSLNMADVAARLAGLDNPAVAVSFAFLMSGLGIKAGFVPFHAWLADAHPAAPSPVSAVLSGLMINMGVYAMMRVGFVVFGSPQVLFYILMVLGAGSMVIGAVAALRQANLKRLLAYSSISQMGYIGLALGLGTTLGITGAIFHLINQAVIKGLLFLCAGAVIHSVGSADFDRIRGNFAPDRVLSFAFLAGILALAGVPLFSGFSSKWLIYVATFEISPLLTLLTVIVSAITLAYGFKAYSLVFASNPRPDVRPSVLPLSMKIPLILLALLILLLGIAPWIGTEMAGLMATGLDASAYIEGVPL